LTLDAEALIERAKVIISPADAERARKALDRVVEKDAGGALAAFLAEHPKARALLFGVFGSSPYLADLAARDPARLAAALAADPQARVDALIEEARGLETDDEAELMRRLRLIKQEAALVIALADLSKAW
jgi:[glutamine synthetase] adenylyltransferase / [glutamine synthetase]-adenylyl-L-tyrosine phosphorylase